MLFSTCPLFRFLKEDKFWDAAFGSVAFWFIAVILLAISYKLILDKALLRDVDITHELKKGNLAVAIVTAAFLGVVGLIIFGVTN